MKRTLRTGDAMKSPYSIEIVYENGEEEYYLVWSNREGFEERKNLHVMSDEQALDELTALEERKGYLPTGYQESKEAIGRNLRQQEEEFGDVRIFNFKRARLIR